MSNKKGGYSCAFSKCNSRSRRDSRSFFRFPKDPERSKLWLEACGRIDLIQKTPTELSKNYRVCGKHFLEPMFLNDLRNRLQPHAIPMNLEPDDTENISEITNKNIELVLPDCNGDKCINFDFSVLNEAYNDRLSNMDNTSARLVKNSVELSTEYLEENLYTVSSEFTKEMCIALEEKVEEMQSISQKNICVQLMENPNLIQIPAGWCTYVPASGKKCVGFSEFCLKKEKNGAIQPVPNKSLLLSEDMRAHYSAQGKMLSSHLLNLPDKLDSVENIAITLQKLSFMHICCGISALGDVSLSHDTAGYPSTLNNYRHNNCPILTITPQCNVCRSVKKSIE